MSKTVYMCATDWNYEIDAIKSEVYPSIENLKHHRDCWEGCGIVELKVEEVRMVVPENPERFSNAYSSDK